MKGASSEQREFLLSGTTPREWSELMTALEGAG